MMAAAVFGFTACQNELEEVRLLDPSEVVAPVLHEIPSEIVITPDNMSETFTISWDKAYFGQPVQYTYNVYATGNGGSLIKLYGPLKDTKVDVVYEDFNQLVTTDAAKGGLGLIAGEENEVSFTVGATVGNGYQTFYSNYANAVVTPTQAERVYKTVWLPGTANGWDHSKAQFLFCYAEDDNTFVGTTDFGEDFASNQFKLTGAAAWGDDTGNWGMADPSAAAESASITLLNGSNDNISIYTAHRYYNFTFTKNDLVLKKNEGFDQVGVIGLNGDWNTDIVMTLSKKQKFYADIDATSDTEFKFRLDAAWGTNWGGDMEGLAKDGANIAVKAGQYRVYLDLNDWNKPTCKLDASMYGKDEDVEEPEPPVTYTGWGIIGDFNNWDGDARMTEKGGVWTGYFTNVENGGFKLRKDADWAENYGGNMVSLGEPFDAVAGGDNLSTPAAGFYKVVLDLSGDTPKITVSDGTVWSLIGVGGDWENDIDMELTDGKWVSPATTISGEFKLRYNHGWDENRGGAFVSVGTAFTAEPGGSNINVPEGEYIVTYDPAAETILIEGALPSNTWSLIGVNGDWNNDIFMSELGSGLWISPVVEFGGEFKLRFDHGWDVNRGGTFEKTGARFAVTNGGSNINVPDGKYQIIYNPALETVTVNTTASNWSVIGEVEGHSWDFDIYMSEVSNQVFESDVFRANAGFKIRYNGGWDVNRGGTFAADGTDFTAVDGGSNIDLGDYKGQLVKISYNFVSETLNVKVAWCIIGEVNGTSWGEDFAMTETSNGVWEGSVVVNGGFKIRKSGNWDINRGGTLASLGTAFSVTNNGDNISVPETGKSYKIVYKVADETITVTEN